MERNIRSNDGFQDYSNQAIDYAIHVDNRAWLDLLWDEMILSWDDESRIYQDLKVFK